MNSNFINCTFINSNIDIAKGIAEIEHLDEKPFGVTYNLTFDNCEFKDVNTANSLFTNLRLALETSSRSRMRSSIWICVRERSRCTVI